MADNSASDGVPCGTSRDGSMKKIPIAMNATSGRSFPIVSAFSTTLLWRMPLMLMTVMTAISATMSAARESPAVSAGM